MQGIAKPVGGGHTGKAVDQSTQAATIKEWNKRLRAEILRKKGLPPDYGRTKEQR